MRVITISDMEGVAGIVKWEQVSVGDPMLEEGERAQSIGPEIDGRNGKMPVKYS